MSSIGKRRDNWQVQVRLAGSAPITSHISFAFYATAPLKIAILRSENSGDFSLGTLIAK